MLSNDTIVIQKGEILELSGGSFQVCIGDKYADLSPDEALMVVATFIITKKPHQWLKSEGERKQESARRASILSEDIEKDLRRSTLKEEK